MKLVIIAALACAALAAATPALTSYNDFGDIESMSGSAEKTAAFLACYANKGPCSKDAAYYKSVVPDFVKDTCSKCTELQKKQINIILSDCYKYFPEQTNLLKALLDPEDKLFPALHAVIGYVPASTTP